MEEKELKLLEKIEKTNNDLAAATWKSASVWWTLLRGIISGFGVFIGTVLLTAILIYVLSKVEGWAYIGRYAHNVLEIISQSSKQK